MYKGWTINDPGGGSGKIKKKKNSLTFQRGKRNHQQVGQKKNQSAGWPGKKINHRLPEKNQSAGWPGKKINHRLYAGLGCSEHGHA